MPQVPLRENIFNHVCFLTGRMGRVLGLKLKAPIFIIGTGRCGTTLLVRILNSHPAICGFPGEANEIWHPMLEPYKSASIDIPPIEVDPKQFSEISVTNWPRNQREKIRDIFTGFDFMTGLSKVFFTKSAEISFMIPTILEIFPDAGFIHIYRYGPSVVESYFKKNFGTYSKYIFTEKEYRNICAKYWNACILEIERSKLAYSLEEKGQFLEFSYENLCQNPRKILEVIASFLGVASDNFAFDISEIKNHNSLKLGYSQDSEHQKLLDVMYPGLKLKGYMHEYHRD